MSEYEDEGIPMVQVPHPVYVEVRRYAQGPCAPRKPWFRRAVQLAFTLGYRAGAATERARYLEAERRNALASQRSVTDLTAAGAEASNGQ